MEDAEVRNRSPSYYQKKVVTVVKKCSKRALDIAWKFCVYWEYTQF